MKCTNISEGTLLPDAQIVKTETSAPSGVTGPTAARSMETRENSPAAKVAALAIRLGHLSGEIRLLAAVFGVLLPPTPQPVAETPTHTQPSTLTHLSTPNRYEQN